MAKHIRLWSVVAGVVLSCLSSAFASDILYVIVNPAGANYVAAYTQDPQSGALTFLASFPTGGTGLVNDDFVGAEQNSLVFSKGHLYAINPGSNDISIFSVQPDGTLLYKQQYYWLHVPDNADRSGADGMRVDRDGRLYVATAMGVQICDQAGRVNAILRTPNGRVSNLSFGGENFDTLYVTSGDKVYKRKLKSKGANAWDSPLKPASFLSIPGCPMLIPKRRPGSRWC